MNNLNLRPLEETDAPALQRACWPETPLSIVQERVASFIRQHQKGWAWGLVARHGKEVVGFGQLMRCGSRYEICDLIIGEQWRGQGIGTALISRLIGIAREQGAREVEIGGAVSNPYALALYRRLGFRDRRRVMLDLGDAPEPVIYLSLNLKEAPG